MKIFKRALSIFMCLLMLTGTISLFSFYSSAAEADATELYVGSVKLRPGEYLAEGSTTPSYEKPSGDYIEFTGSKVNMYDFDYTGPGYTVNHIGGKITAAIHLNGKSAIYVNGENSINITGDTYCTGIFSSGSLTIRDTSYYGSSLDISGSVKTGIFMPTEGSKLNVFFAAVIISGATVENSYGIKCNGDIDFGSNAYINISAMRKGILSSSKIDFTSYSSVNIEVSRIALEGDLSTTEINFKGGYVCLKAGQYIVDCGYSNITGLENLNGVAGVNKNGSGAVAFNKSDILTYKYAELVHNTFKEYHYGLIGNKFITPGVKLSEIEITLDEFFCYNSLIKDFTPGAWKKSKKNSSELTDFTECAADEAAQDGYYYLKEFTVSFKEGVIVDTSKAYLNFRGVSVFGSYKAKCLSNGDGTYLLYIYDNYVTGDDVFNEEEGYSLTIKNCLPGYDISDKIDEGGSAGLYAMPYSDYKKFARWENTVNLDKVSNYADFDPLKYLFSFDMPAYDISVEAVFEPCGIFIDGVELKDGDYLPSGAAAATKEKPASGGYAYFNNRVLTLDNFTCTSGGMSLYQGYDDSAIIIIPGSCDIILKGKNVLTGVGEDVSGIYTESTFYDEATDYELDGGNINITAENDASLELMGISEYGIYTDEGKLTVNGGTITINSINRSFSVGDIDVKNCTLNLYNDNYRCISCVDGLFEASAINLESKAEGIYGYGCTFNNCDVSIKSVYSYGIYGSNQKVIFNGGTYNIDSNYSAIEAHTVEINDGVFNLTAKSNSISGNVITINSGIISCVSVSSYGSSVYASEILTINGGIINIKAVIPENGTGSAGNIYAYRFIMNDGYLSCESDSECCLGKIGYFFDYYGGQLKLKANGTSTKAWCCTEFYDKSAGVTKKAGTSADGTSLADFDIANAASYKYVEFSKPITATIKNVDNPPSVNFKAGDKITLTATEMAYKNFIGWRTVGCEAADPKSKTTTFTFYYGGAEIEALYECAHTGGTATCTDKAVCTLCSQPYGETNPSNHTNLVSIPAVPATCKANGLTEGQKCNACGTVTKAQTQTDKAPHTEKDLPAVPSTCKAEGKTAGKQCTFCNVITVPQDTTAKANHTEEVLPKVDPTCTTKGKTEGKKCSFCGVILKEQVEVDTLSHSDANGDYKCDYNCGYEFPKPTEPTTEPTTQPSGGSSTEPTTKPSGGSSTEPTTKPSGGSSTEPTTKPSGGTSTEPTTKPSGGSSTEPTTKPSGGSSTEPTTKPSGGGASTEPTTKPSGDSTTEPTTKPSTPQTHTHKPVVIPAVPATYKNSGKTEGKKCSECGTILAAQRTVARKKLKKVSSVKTKSVKLASGTKTTLTLSWKKVTGAEKYVVQQYVNKKWKTVATTKKTYYTVKKLKANKSYKFRVKAQAGKYYGSYSKTYTAKTVPLKPTLTVKAGKKQLTASWKTVANITGYEVQYSTSKKFTKKTTKKVTIKKAKTKKTTIKKLKKGKKYFVKVRAYKTVGKKKIYSSWSTVKTVKVK